MDKAGLESRTRALSLTILVNRSSFVFHLVLQFCNNRTSNQNFLCNYNEQNKCNKSFEIKES